MQGMEQAMDVQLADVHCDQQPPNERVAHRAALQVVPATPLAMSIAPMEVDTAQPMQRAMQKPRIPLHCRAAIGAGDVAASHANHHSPPTGPGAQDVHCTQLATPHALPSTSGSSDVTQNPSRLRFLQPDRPGWVPRCLYGLLRAVSMRMMKD